MRDKGFEVIAMAFFINDLEKDGLFVVGIDLEVQHNKIKLLLPVIVGIFLLEVS